MRTEPSPLPLLREARRPGESLLDRLATEAGAVRADLDEHGAVLFRGFADWRRLDDVVRAWGAGPLAYREAATPRTEVGDHVYTSTDYPAAEEIHLHHEACYAENWPGYLYFGCVTAAAERGGTTLADARRMLDALPADVVDRFRERGVTYIRTYHPRFGLSWQRAFGTDDPAEVMRRCAESGTPAEWIGDGVLQTRRTWPAVVRHPETSEECWFNQVAAFHPHGLPRDLRSTLTRLVGADLLPKQVRYGDGTAIEPETVEQIIAAGRTLTAAARWRPGDVLIVDNILAGHGREPYTGERRVVVAMSHERSWGDVAPAAPRERLLGAGA
ncbi:TauD/TfdA family dioxygenase [Actinomadura welshii]